MNSRHISLATLLFVAPAAQGATSAPFPISNQNPFIQIFGIPATSSPWLQNSGETDVQVVADITNNSIITDAGQESISLDGESYRYAVVIRHGLNAKLQVGAELAYISHRPGIMDNFIEGWHDIFGLSNAERSKTPSNVLDYSYQLNGVQQLGFQSGNSGIADSRFFADYALLSEPGQALSLHASLKLSTGEARELHGSGSHDLGIGLSYGENQWLKAWDISTHTHGGLTFLGKGDVLPERQNSVIAYGGGSITWHSGSWIDLKAQLDAHSAAFDSELAQLGDSAIQLTIGGTARFGKTLAVDIGVGENLFTDPTPDFLINLVFRRPI